MSDSLNPQSKHQSSESVKRVSRPDPTDGRTKGRTKNLQDPGEHVQFLDAHENSADSDFDPTPIGTTLRAVADQIAQAGERMPYTRQGETRGVLEPQVRSMVLLRDGYTCQWCKKHIRDGARFEIDHIVPWSAGGSNATDNLRTLCTDCNQSRSNLHTDAQMATALLIVGTCPWCRGRHLISRWESEDGHSSYVYDEDAPTIVSRADREVPIWCISCRTISSTSRTHAAEVRAKQANRWASAEYIASREQDYQAWKAALA